MDKLETLKSDKWTVEFTGPGVLDAHGVNPVKVSNGIVTTCDVVLPDDGWDWHKESVGRLCRKIQHDIDNIHIEFGDRDDHAVQQQLRQWIDCIDADFKDAEEGLLKWFEFSDDAQHPGAVSMTLKRPLSELTEQDKQEIIDLLTSVTDMDEDKIRAAFEV